MRFALRLAGPGVFLCAAFISGVSFGQNYTFLTNDPIREQLLTMGKPGLTIAQARDHVIEILQSKIPAAPGFKRWTRTPPLTSHRSNSSLRPTGQRRSLACSRTQGKCC